MNTKKQKRIESYLDGTLSPVERKQFEQALKTDSNLREELQLHQSLANSLANPKIHDLRAALKTVDEEVHVPKPKPKTKVLGINARRWMGVAAGLLLLLMVGYQLFFTNTPLTDAEIFAQYHQPYRMILAERSNTDSPLLNEAVTSYQNQQYENAAQAFANLSAGDATIIVYPFYQAIALLSQNKAADAIPILEKILAQSNHLFIQQSRWYLALAYVQIGEIASAQQQLQAIAPQHYAYNQAQQLLKTLNSNH